MDLSDKTVCVTGAAGFFGSHLCEALEERGIEYRGVDVDDYDLTDREAVDSLFEDIDPDVIIHLAANVGGIEYNRKYPADIFYDNSMMALHLIRASVEHGLDKFVGIGSVCAYPRDIELPFSEEDLWNGYPEETNAPYGMSKKVMLEYTKAARDQHDLNAIHLIPVNMYGPRDDFDLENSHVIPSLIRKFLEAKDAGKESVTAWGTGKPTREFLYAPDAAEGVITATEEYDGREPVNLGSGEEISIKDLVNLIREKTGFQGEVEWDTSKPDGQPRRRFDTGRAEERFGWQASTGFEEGLENTIDWYDQNRPL